MGFDFIVIAPLLLSCSFSLVFGHEYLFFGEFQSPSVGGFSIASCDFGALAGGNECISFYSAILDQSPILIFFFIVEFINISFVQIF